MAFHAQSTKATRWLRGFRGLLAATLVLAVLLSVLHREVLFRGAVYHMDDAADGYYPGRVAYRRALSEGTLPSWEPNTSAGWPLVSDPYYGYFYPLNFVFFLGQRSGEPNGGLASGVPAGLGLSVALHALLAGIGMYLFLSAGAALGPGAGSDRASRRRLSFGAALFGSISYALSSFLVVRTRHVIFVQLMAWLPFLMAAIDDYVTTRRRRSLALCGLTTGMLLLTGAHSILHFVALLLAIHTSARVLAASLAQPSGARLRFAVSVGGALLVAALCGALVGAIALAPTLTAMPDTTRALGTDYKFASSYGWPGLRYLQLLLLPDAMGLGESRLQPWMGPWNHWELAGYYQGAVALLLALPGALLGPVRPDATAVDGAPRGLTARLGIALDLPRLALLLCAVAGILIALGDDGPLHPILYRFLPLYGALRCPSRALLMGVVATPILAAHAADRWLGPPAADDAPPASRPAPQRQRRALSIAIVVALGLSAIGFWCAARLLRMPPPQTPGMVWVVRSIAHLIPVVGLSAALLVLRVMGRVRGLGLLLLLCLLSAYDQLAIDRGYVQPQPADYAYGMERFHAMEWLLQKQAQGAQAVGPAAGSAGIAAGDEVVPFRFAPDPRGPFRLMAVGQTLNLESASGYSSVQIWRYRHLLYILRNGHPYPHRKQVDDLAAASIWGFDSPLIDMLNIRYIVGSVLPSPKWKQVFAPKAGEPPHARYEPTWDQQLRVFENTQVMPRAFVAYRGRLAVDEAHEASLVAQRDFDPHREIVVGPVPASARRGAAKWPAPWPPALEGGNRPIHAARVVVHDRHRVVIEAQAQAAGMLVLADAYFPGWSATVDGTAQPIYPVNLALRGVALLPGTHRVEFRYDARPVRVGAWLSALGLLLILALALLPLPRRSP